MNYEHIEGTSRHVFIVGVGGMMLETWFNGVRVKRMPMNMNRKELLEFREWLNKRIDETWSRAPAVNVVDK